MVISFDNNIFQKIRLVIAFFNPNFFIFYKHLKFGKCYDCIFRLWQIKTLIKLFRIINVVAVDFDEPLAFWDKRKCEIVVIIQHIFLALRVLNLHAVRVFSGDKTWIFGTKFQNDFLAAVRAVIVGDDTSLNGGQNACQTRF